MSREYMNGKWCVRCGRSGPTPFLRSCVRHKDRRCTVQGVQVYTVVDAGCGNGRNSKWLCDNSDLTESVLLDMAGPAPSGPRLSWTQADLGLCRWPVFSRSADLVLLQYSLMFLNPEERLHVLSETARVVHSFGWVVVELYPAKDSELRDLKRLPGFANALLRSFRRVRRSGVDLVRRTGNGAHMLWRTR